jgi:hypothetical protein
MNPIFLVPAIRFSPAISFSASRTKIYLGNIKEIFAKSQPLKYLDCPASMPEKLQTPALFAASKS